MPIGREKWLCYGGGTVETADRRHYYGNSKKAGPARMHLHTYLYCKVYGVNFVHLSYAMNFVCIHPGSPVSQHESIRLG
jgi:hypothetical protein